jgi:Uncharacterized protein conserved in bacteria
MTDAERRGGKRRRVRRGVIAAVLSILSAVAGTIDWWAPAAGEAWLGGVGHARRTTAPGRTVSWENLEWEGDGLRLRVEALRVTAPSRLLLGAKAAAEGRGWLLEIRERPETVAADETDETGAWETWVPRLREIGEMLERRVGAVQLNAGVVRVAGEEIAVDRVEVNGAELHVTARGRGQTIELSANPVAGRGMARWVEGAVEISARVEPTSARATLDWEGRRAEAEASFSAGTWWPATLDVRGDGWRVPAEKLGLATHGYEDLEGGFVLRGEGPRIAGSVDAVARPKEAGLPPVRMRVSANGDAAGVRVESFELVAPQARASLSAPVEWRAGLGWNTEGEPVFAWEANLAELSGGVLRGRVEGDARWTGGASDAARVRWTAKGSNLAWRHLEDVTLAMRGESDVAATTVEEATFAAGEGSRIEAHGRFVHATRALERATLNATVDGGLLAPWLPEETSVARVEAELQAAGAWTALVVDGVARVANVEATGWAAETVDAKLSGVVGERLRADATVKRGPARLVVLGEWTPAEWTLEEFSARREDGAELRATRPARLRGAAGTREVELELAGPGETRARVSWRESEEAGVFIQNLDTAWARDWRSGEALPEVALRRLSIAGRTGEGGALEGEGDFEIAGRVANDSAWARGAGRIGRDGARLEKLEAGGTRAGDGAENADEVLVSGTGVLPWRVRRDGDAWTAEPVDGGRWDFRLESTAEASWWSELAKIAKLDLAGPVLRLRVEGEATAPHGVAELGAERVVLRGEGLPEGGLELRELRAEAELARDVLELRRLEAKVDGQHVEAAGRLAMTTADDWAGLRERPFVWVRDHAEARVSVPGAEVAAFARYLPTLLAPQGVLRAELRMSPGARIDGTLELSGAATRPLGAFGVLQDVEVTLALSGMDARIGKMRATAGGQAVTVTGGARRIPGRMPFLDLAVKAERFPLVRKPGLLLRGDLDLAVKTSETDGRTKIGGEVRLRDSLFLADIRPLLAPIGGRGAAAAARARPPFFSVEEPPLADWELGLRVGGLDFLRLRTPVFEGVGSARFDLTGTLREPRAIGEFWVERGNILFPFATFAVQEGAVRLRASDPYTPALEFRATGRRLGYDLRLEIGGTAESPRLQLTSSPPLEAETVLLMVTAGTAPSQGTGAASRTQRLAAVGAYVGRDLLRTLGIAGADEERLTMSSGEKVSRAGRETYGLEFKLNERWSLTGEYDEFDAYNVGVKRRFGPGVKAEAEDKAEKGAEDAR